MGPTRRQCEPPQTPHPQPLAQQAQPPAKPTSRSTCAVALPLRRALTAFDSHTGAAGHAPPPPPPQLPPPPLPRPLALLPEGEMAISASASPQSEEAQDDSSSEEESSAEESSACERWWKLRSNAGVVAAVAGARSANGPSARSLWGANYG